MKVAERLHDRMLGDGWGFDPDRFWYVRMRRDIVMPGERLVSKQARYETRLPTNRNRKRARCQARRRARREAQRRMQRVGHITTGWLRRALAEELMGVAVVERVYRDGEWTIVQVLYPGQAEPYSLRANGRTPVQTIVQALNRKADDLAAAA